MSLALSVTQATKPVITVLDSETDPTIRATYLQLYLLGVNAAKSTEEELCLVLAGFKEGEEKGKGEWLEVLEINQLAPVVVSRLIAYIRWPFDEDYYELAQIASIDPDLVQVYVDYAGSEDPEVADAAEQIADRLAYELNLIDDHYYTIFFEEGTRTDTVDLVARTCILGKPVFHRTNLDPNLAYITAHHLLQTDGRCMRVSAPSLEVHGPGSKVAMAKALAETLRFKDEET